LANRAATAAGLASANAALRSLSAHAPTSS
jgi:hypothetical protein